MDMNIKSNDWTIHVIMDTSATHNFIIDNKVRWLKLNTEKSLSHLKLSLSWRRSYYQNQSMKFKHQNDDVIQVIIFYLYPNLFGVNTDDIHIIIIKDECNRKIKIEKHDVILKRNIIPIYGINENFHLRNQLVLSRTR